MEFANAMQCNIIDFANYGQGFKQKACCPSFGCPSNFNRLSIAFLVAAAQNESDEDVDTDVDMDFDSWKETSLPQAKKQKTSREHVSPGRRSPVNSAIDKSEYNQVQLGLDEKLKKEMKLMREYVDKWFEDETTKSPEEGYNCMWVRSCRRTIKGRGNFCKHLLWHLKGVEDGWSGLIRDHSEWPCLIEGFQSQAVRKD